MLVSRSSASTVMKLLILLSYVVVVLCLVETVSSNIKDFFSHLVNTISETWTKMITAIKKPVRIRRLGHVGKIKTTTILTTSMSTPTNMSTIAIYLFLKKTRPLLKKPTIPVFTHPRFKSMVEWHKQQLPYLWKPIKDFEDSPLTTVFKIDQNSPEDNVLANYKNNTHNQSVSYELK